MVNKDLEYITKQLESWVKYDEITEDMELTHLGIERKVQGSQYGEDSIEPIFDWGGEFFQMLGKGRPS